MSDGDTVEPLLLLEEEEEMEEESRESRSGWWWDDVSRGSRKSDASVDFLSAAGVLASASRVDAEPEVEADGGELSSSAAFSRARTGTICFSRSYSDFSPCPRDRWTARVGMRRMGLEMLTRWVAYPGVAVPEEEEGERTTTRPARPRSRSSQVCQRPPP